MASLIASSSESSLGDLSGIATSGKDLMYLSDAGVRTTGERGRVRGMRGFPRVG